MHRTITILIALVAVSVQNPAAAAACGDKFLLLGRGVKFQRAYAAIHPASILIYAQPQRSATRAIRDPRLQNELKRAGHRVWVVDSQAALAQVIDEARIDLVLTDVADADATARTAAASAVKPAVLPVMYEPTAQEAKSIEARYQCRLKASDRVERYLSSIDDAMKTRLEQKKRRVS